MSTIIQGIHDSTFAGQAIVYLIILMSIGSWGVILYKLRWFRKYERDLIRFEELFNHLGGNLDALHEQTAHARNNPAASLFENCYREIHMLAPREANVAVIHGEVVEGVERASERSIAETEIHLDKGMPMLLMTASISPLLGLLGTVWGILEVFQAMDQTASPSIRDMAPGMSSALITTIFGLLAAIPAAGAYNLFAIRINRVIAALENHAGRISNILVRHQIRQSRQRGD